MASIDNIKKRVNDEKHDMIANMDAADLKDYIHKSCRNYYVDFINDNDKDFNATASILEYIKKNAEYNNVSNFINYSMIIAVNTLLNSLMDRKMDLILPDVVDLTATDNAEDESTVNLLERVNQKRKELRDLQKANDEYFKNLEIDMMATGDYVKHLIRPDINPDFINDHLEILKDILTDEGMDVIRHYINNGGE